MKLHRTACLALFFMMTGAHAALISTTESVFNFDFSNQTTPSPYPFIDLELTTSTSNPLGGSELLKINLYGNKDGSSLIRSVNFGVNQFAIGGLLTRLQVSNGNGTDSTFDRMLDGRFSIGLQMISGTIDLNTFLGCTGSCQPSSVVGALQVGSDSVNPSNLGASVITSFRNYIEGSQNTEKTYLERINECAALGAACDFDTVKNDQDFQRNLRNAADATFASRDLVTRTSILPQNKLELAADAPALLQEIKAFFQWIGILQGNNDTTETSDIEIEGEAGQFTVNPTFDYDINTYSVDFDSDSFFTNLAGKDFLFSRPSGNWESYTGYGFVESVEKLANGGQRVVFWTSELGTNDALPSDSNAVPVPGTVGLLMVGLILCTLVRRKFQHKAQDCLL